MFTDEGEREIAAPYTFVSGPNVKKAGWVLEDTVWLNVHPWDGEMTVDQIEQLVIIPVDEAEQLMRSETKWLG